MTKKETAILQEACLTALERLEEATENGYETEMEYYGGAYKVTRFLCKSFGIPYPIAISEDEEDEE